MKQPKDAFMASLTRWFETVMHESMHGFVAYAREKGLSMSQVGALFFLHRSGECGMADLVESLGVSNAAASQLMDRLVQNGFVVRSESPEDRRAKRLELTTEGQRIVRETLEARQRWLGRLADVLTDLERERVADALDLLSARTRELQERNE